MEWVIQRDVCMHAQTDREIDICATIDRWTDTPASLDHTAQCCEWSLNLIIVVCVLHQYIHTWECECGAGVSDLWSHMVTNDTISQITMHSARHINESNRSRINQSNRSIQSTHLWIWQELEMHTVACSDLWRYFTQLIGRRRCIPSRQLVRRSVWCDVMWCGVMWLDVMWCGVIDHPSDDKIQFTNSMDRSSPTSMKKNQCITITDSTNSDSRSWPKQQQTWG